MTWKKPTCGHAWSNSFGEEISDNEALILVVLARLEVVASDDVVKYFGKFFF
jgi:hypothetical protein